MRTRGRVFATWAVLLLVLSLNRWSRATKDPAQSALDAAWIASRGQAEAVARAAPALVAIQARGPRKEESGSGVVVDAAGLVLTALHVVDGADRIRVRDRDGRDFPARVRGVDQAGDLALLQIEAPDRRFRPVRFGSSADAQVGERVFALGSPFGLTQTVTSGVLSAKERTGVVADNVVPLLQTDAPINPGSSGGVLLNARGEMIGLVNAILTRSGQSQGVGFAVPADELVRALPSLREGRPVPRPWIGVRVKTGRGEGVEILSVTAGGPADRSGLRPGDRIVRFGGEEIRHSAQVRNRLRVLPIGEAVELQALRDGEIVVLSVPVTSRIKNPNKTLKPAAR